MLIRARIVPHGVSCCTFACIPPIASSLHPKSFTPYKIATESPQFIMLTSLLINSYQGGRPSGLFLWESRTCVEEMDGPFYSYQEQPRKFLGIPMFSMIFQYRQMSFYVLMENSSVGSQVLGIFKLLLLTLFTPRALDFL